MTRAVKPGYKLTEVGVIPEDWVCLAVLYIASKAKNSIVGGPFGSDLVSSDYVTAGIPVIRGQNMGGRYLSGDYVFVSYSKARKLHANTARANDIVFTQRGTLGQVAIVPKKPFDEYIISQSQMKVTLNAEIADVQFIYHYFSSFDGQKQITESAIQTGVPHTNLGILKTYKLPLPSNIAEQYAIAAILSDVDALLDGLDRLIAKKRDLKQAAMQQLLTGQTRLPGFSGDWDVRELGDIAIIRDGTHKTPKYVSFGIPFYSVENVTSGDFTNTKFISAEEHQVLTRSVRIEKGDILMTRIGSIGECKFLDFDVDASFYVSLALLKIQPRFSAEFISKYSNTTAFKLEVELHSLPSAIPKKINLGPISNIRIKLPPSLAEQTAIATILSDMDAEIAALEARRDKTRALKQGMMQELLTGRIRLV